MSLDAAINSCIHFVFICYYNSNDIKFGTIMENITKNLSKQWAASKP